METYNDTMICEIKEQPDVLKNTIHNNQPVLEIVKRELAQRITAGDIDNILLVARGSSDNAATVGKYILETLTGLPVSLAAPSIVNLYNVSLHLRRTLVIAISQSGTTNEVIQFMTRVKSMAGFSIGITNIPGSDLDRLGLNANFLCHAGIEKAIAATKSFSSTMMVLYLLATALHIPDMDDGQLNAVPELMRRSLDLEEEIMHAGGWLASKAECIILARGYNYPVALEAGLKLQESAYIRAKSYSGADFQHGPLAVTEEGVPFVVFKASGPSYDGMDWLANQLLAKGGEMVVFSSEAAEPESVPKRKVIRVPYCDEWLSPFVFTVVSQLLAYHTARIRGINPDTPRWLHKITITQ